MCVFSYYKKTNFNSYLFKAVFAIKIYMNYVKENKIGYMLFWYFFVFWSLYGFAAIFPYYIKNSFYNILDLFSKNFFGIFLSYILFVNRI